MPSIWAGGAATTCKSMLPKKEFLSKSKCSKSIFNNLIVTLTIYSFCRLSDFFWSVDITFWMMVGILVEFNVSCNVGAGQLNGRVPSYVNRITLQAAIRIAIRANRCLYGRKVVPWSYSRTVLTQIIPPVSFVVFYKMQIWRVVLHL